MEQFYLVDLIADTHSNITAFTGSPVPDSRYASVTQPFNTIYVDSIKENRNI